MTKILLSELQKDCMGKFSYNTHEHVSDQNL